MDDSQTRSAAYTQCFGARCLLGSLIFDLRVYLTPVVEWSRAQVDRGSIPVTLQINFFLFSCFSLISFWLLVFRALANYSR